MCMLRLKKRIEMYKKVYKCTCNYIKKYKMCTEMDVFFLMYLLGATGHIIAKQEPF